MSYLGAEHPEENHSSTAELRCSARVAQQQNISAGCSKRPFSKAAASEEARRTLRYVEPLSDARTPLADFFSILLKHLIQGAQKLLQLGRRRVETCGVPILTRPPPSCQDSSFPSGV